MTFQELMTAAVPMSISTKPARVSVGRLCAGHRRHRSDRVSVLWLTKGVYRAGCWSANRAAKHGAGRSTNPVANASEASIV